MINYRQVGERLAVYYRSTSSSPKQVIAVLSDLLAGDELLPTMRDIASRQDFAVLLGLAGSGGGLIQRDALLSEISLRYLPGVVADVGEVLNGLLALQSTASRSVSVQVPDSQRDVLFVDQNRSPRFESANNRLTRSKRGHASDIPSTRNWRRHEIYRKHARATELTGAEIARGLMTPFIFSGALFLGGLLCIGAYIGFQSSLDWLRAYARDQDQWYTKLPAYSKCRTLPLSELRVIPEFSDSYYECIKQPE